MDLPLYQSVDLTLVMVMLACLAMLLIGYYTFQRVATRIKKDLIEELGKLEDQLAAQQEQREALIRLQAETLKYVRRMADPEEAERVERLSNRRAK